MYRLPGHPKKQRLPKLDISQQLGEEVLDPKRLLPLYHGTSSDRAVEIDKKGLCTPKSCRARQVWKDAKLFKECRKQGIYVTPEAFTAEDYANIATEDKAKPVVYVIERWNKKCKLFEDPEMDPSYGPAQYVVAGCDCIKPTRKYFAKEWV